MAKQTLVKVIDHSAEVSQGLPLGAGSERWVNPDAVRYLAVGGGPTYSETFTLVYFEAGDHFEVIGTVEAVADQLGYDV
jgi:hypothetical protein